MSEKGQYALRSSQGLVPCGREDCRGGVPRQRYAQKFLPLLQWSSSVFTSCFADCSLVPASLRLSCEGTPVTPTPPFAFSYFCSFSLAPPPQPVLLLVLFASLTSSEELPRRRLKSRRMRDHPGPHASTSTRGSVSFSVANVGTITSRCDLGPASQQALCLLQQGISEHAVRDHPDGPRTCPLLCRLISAVFDAGIVLLAPRRGPAAPLLIQNSRSSSGVPSGPSFTVSRSAFRSPPPSWFAPCRRLCQWLFPARLSLCWQSSPNMSGIQFPTQSTCRSRHAGPWPVPCVSVFLTHTWQHQQVPRFLIACRPADFATLGATARYSAKKVHRRGGAPV